MPVTHPNAATIQRFYDAFDKKDSATMVAQYAPDVTFSDPAFGELHGPEAGAMWTMLCGRATDLTVAARDVEANDTSGSAHWTARYTFATGRPVVNEIDARFRFDADGRIVEHRDSFSMFKWSRQALGPPAYLLGWNPIGHKVLQGKARRQLDEYLEAQRPPA
jgi:ketosteroid isomerase-like protein